MRARTTWMALLVMACGNASHAVPDASAPDASSPDPTEFLFVPYDRTTGVDADAPLLLLWATAAQDPSDVQAVHGALHLTRADGVELELDVASSDLMSSVSPREPLADGTYQFWISLADVPPEIAPWPMLSTDRAGVRFRVGSRPLLRALAFRTLLAGDPPEYLHVEFTEPMAADTPEHITVEGIACDAGVLDGSSVDYMCPTARVEDEITIRLDVASLRSASGVALEPPPEGDVFSFVPAERGSFGGALEFTYWPE
jgi:hypothetical protein